MTGAPRLVMTAPPAIEPVGVDVLKDHLKIDHDEEDALLSGIVTAARTFCEDHTGRALVNRGYSLYLDGWPGKSALPWWDGVRDGADMPVLASQVNLPRPPLVSVEDIVLHADDDSSDIWDTARYFVDTAATPGRVVLRNGASPPQASRAANGIEIRFTAGFGAAASDVPETLREGIRRLAAHLYANRGDTPDAAAEHCGAKLLWQPWRVMGLA